MLLAKLSMELEKRFPELLYNSDVGSKELVIPSGNEAIGDVMIHDDSSELTVHVGNFSHWHVSYHEKNTDEITKEKVIVEEVMEFLADLFRDEIVLWGNSPSYSGFYHRGVSEEMQDTPIEDESESIKRYVWSGQEIS